MAHVVKWTSLAGTFDIGHSDQKGFSQENDADGLHRISVRLIITELNRDDYEDRIENLLTVIRKRPLIIKTTNFGRKYIVPNGTQGILTTEYRTTRTVYPEDIQVEEQDPWGAWVTVTFVRAL